MIDRNENVISTIDVEASLYDVDIVDNMVNVGDRFGKVYIADLELQNYEAIEVEDLDPSFNERAVFILGDSVDNSNIIIDLIFERHCAH